MPIATLSSSSATASTSISSSTAYKLSLVGKGATPPGTPQPRDESAAIVPRPRRTVHPNGAIDHFARQRVTPAIGVEFDRSVQLKRVLALADLDERRRVLAGIAYEISLHGAAFFRAQDDLSPADIGQLALLLGEASGKPADSGLHIHPTQELSEDGSLPVGRISNVADADGRQISFLEDDKSEFASGGWHTDISFEPRPAAYTILRMHTLPRLGGDTLFLSAYALYDKLSPPMRTFLEGLQAVHDAETFRSQARRHGFSLFTGARGAPDNSGDSFQAVHPIIRTNPVTGLRGVFVNKTFTRRILGVTVDESRALLNHLFALADASHDAMVRFRWENNDVAIWDNRSTQHVATFDYGNELRVGDRVVVCGEKPFLDVEGSMSRAEFDRLA